MSTQIFDIYEEETKFSSSFGNNQFTLETKLILESDKKSFKNEFNISYENKEIKDQLNEIFPLNNILSSENIDINNIKNNKPMYSDLYIDIKISGDKKNKDIYNLEISKLTEEKIFSSKKRVKEKSADNDSESKFQREDNCRRMIGRSFFNKFLKSKIESMKRECRCILFLNNFPRKFIFEAVKKGNKNFLEYTLEELIEKEELYKDKDSEISYAVNLNVIRELKSEKNRDIMEKYGYDKILKMNYRDLFEEYLKSNEFKQKIYNLKTKEKLKADKFEYYSYLFIQGFSD